MVSDAIPEINVLDATTSAHWIQLAIWAAALPESPKD